MRESLSMWSYWREKRGSAIDAIESDYPQLLASCPSLQEAVAMIKRGEALIDEFMDGDREEGDEDLIISP